MEAVASVDAALRAAEEDGAGELCVIGGAQVYALTLPLATSLRLTHVDTVVEGSDAFFPEFEAGPWRVVSRERHAADARHAFVFEFVGYLRAPRPQLRGGAPAPSVVRPSHWTPVL